METSNRKRGARSGWERRRELGAPAAYVKVGAAGASSATASANGGDPSRSTAPGRPVIWYYD